MAKAPTPRIAKLRGPIIWKMCVEQFELMIEDDATEKAGTDAAAEIRFDS